MSEIGQRLRDFMASQKLSIEELSQSIEPRTRVTSVLRGKQRLPSDILEKLIKVHAIDANWLITGQVKPAPKSVDVGAQLVNAVRAGFILHGTTLGTYCREHGIALTHARQALIGGWNGPKGKQVRDQLLRASGVVASEQQDASEIGRLPEQPDPLDQQTSSEAKAQQVFIGARLKSERIRLGMTLERFAAACGAGKNTVCNWQAGASSPTADRLAVLNDLGVDVLFVVTGNKSGEPK